MKQRIGAIEQSTAMTSRKRRLVHSHPEWVVFRARGFSMLPGIRPGDALRVARSKTYRPGDVLLFERDGEFLAHRLVCTRERRGVPRQLILRGDNVPECDPPVSPDVVLGRVVRVDRGERRRTLDALQARFWRLLSRASWSGRPLIPQLASVARRVRRKRVV